ncbi:MAG: sigma-70 family RNA polymerase sigma factor [Bacteriovoracia bacterium]
MNKAVQKYKKQIEIEEKKESRTFEVVAGSDAGIEIVSEKLESVEKTISVTGASEGIPSDTKEIEKPKEKLGTREEIIIEYSPLIRYIAQKIAARLPANIDIDDLISAGVIGLMDAIEKYDSSRDNKFKTYAEFRIRGAILDELRAQDWVPRSVREKAKMLEKAYAKIEQELGRQATDEEVCAYLKISHEEYHELLNEVRSIALLSYEDLHTYAKGDKRNDVGIAGSGKMQTPFSELSVARLKQMISRAIEDLPEKQRLVLSLYYYEDLNLKEIGKVLDVTESRVSQLHTQAILRLRARLKTNFDDFLMLMS